MFRADADTDISEQENSNIQYIGYYICILSAECGYQMLVIKICNKGKISYILKQHFTEKLLVVNQFLTLRCLEQRGSSVVSTVAS